MALPTPDTESIKVIDEKLVKTNLHSRVSYLLDFVGLVEVDTEALHAAGPLIRPFISQLVDSVYSKLLSYDITRETFVETKNKHLNKEERLMSVTFESERMKYFKDFFRHWLLKIFICDWDDLQTYTYFDRVGIAHVGGFGFRHRDDRGKYVVDYMHIGLLLGFLSEAVTRKILTMETISLEQRARIISAFTKVMWVQNDLMSRHYVTSVGAIVPQPTHPITSGSDADEPKCPFSSSAARNVEVEPETEPWSDSDDDDTPPAAGEEEVALSVNGQTGSLSKVNEDGIRSGTVLDEKLAGMKL